MGGASRLFGSVAYEIRHKKITTQSCMNLLLGSESAVNIRFSSRLWQLKIGGEILTQAHTKSH